MRFFPADPSSWLFEMGDLTGTPPPTASSADLDVARQVVHWARSYLCAPHPDLGRPGLVCPFVPRSLESSLFFMTVKRGARPSVSDVYDLTLRYRDWFMELEPREGRDAQYKCILLLFPDIGAEDIPALIDEPQDQLKPSFVGEGLMVGQFHDLPPSKAGLWNPDFRPLRSPVPMLVIRTMVTSDLPFLIQERRYMEPFVRRFQGRLSAKQEELIARHHPDLIDRTLPAVAATPR